MIRGKLLAWAVGGLAVLAASAPAVAQWRITGNQPYVINFDSTVSGANQGTFSGSGFASDPAVGQLDSNSWAVRWSSTQTLNYGESQSDGLWARGAVGATDPATSGGFYAVSGTGISGVALGIRPDGSGFSASG